MFPIESSFEYMQIPAFICRNPVRIRHFYSFSNRIKGESRVPHNGRKMRKPLGGIGNGLKLISGMCNFPFRGTGIMDGESLCTDRHPRGYHFEEMTDSRQLIESQIRP